MAIALDFNQPAVDILLDQLNYDNNAGITPQLVVFQNPSANATGAQRNTTVQITSVEGSGFTGSVDWQYNRVDISVVPGIRSTLISVPNGATLISQLLPNINLAYGIQLTAEDIVDGPIPTFIGLPNEKHNFTLVIAATALVYYNSVVLTAFIDGTAYSEVVTAAGDNVITADGDFVVAKNDETSSTGESS
jgi:hypothetical protein